MHHVLSFGGSDRYDVLVTTHGLADSAGFLAFIGAILSDERFRPGMRVLIDHTDLDASSLRAADIRIVAEAVKANDAQIGGTRVAVVAPSDVMFGLTRMFQFLADSTQLRVLATRTRADAVAWLAAVA